MEDIWYMGDFKNLGHVEELEYMGFENGTNTQTNEIFDVLRSYWVLLNQLNHEYVFFSFFVNAVTDATKIPYQMLFMLYISPCM